jgi:hypothetical protein
MHVICYHNECPNLKRPMKYVSKILPWKTNILITLVILLALNILNFYGVYTNRFYFLKPDNYIFPLLSTVHFLYLYVMWFKIKEDELPDPKMRNIEYALYAIMVVYIFKIYDSVLTLTSFPELVGHVIPPTFKPMATLMLVLYSLLPIFTISLFWYRRNYVGHYNFEDYNNNLNIWQ